MPIGSATTATSNVITSLGAGSGIDFAALATNLAAAQFAARIDRNTSQADLADRQISAASTLKSSVLQLASSVGERVRTGDLSSQPQIANPAVATVSRGNASGSGTYTLEVLALASAQILTSPAYAAPTSLTGAGSLTLRFGTITGTTFAEDSAHLPVTIAVPLGATLGDTSGMINAANAGVTAYIANDASGAHLMLKGQEGAANGFVLAVVEDPAEPGLSGLSWSPAGPGARKLASAANAAFKLDGLAMSNASNAITDIAPGLSLSLTGTNVGTPTAIRFSDPSAAVGTFMQDLTAALNEIAGSLGKDAAVIGGDLARDPGARALRRALSQLAGTIVMPGANAGAPASLADLGLATNRDGTFRLDGARLTATLKASPAASAAMFTNGLHGVYATLETLSRSAAAVADPGSLGGSVGRYSALKTRLAKEKTTLTDAQDTLRAQLVKRFAGVDTRVSASRSTLSFLQNQVAAWNAQKN